MQRSQFRFGSWVHIFKWKIKVIKKPIETYQKQEATEFQLVYKKLNQIFLARFDRIMQKIEIVMTRFELF